MNHKVFGYKLSRTKNARRRLIQGLVRDVFKHSMITTTRAKAKAIQPVVEQLITKAKNGSSASLASIRKVLADKNTFEILMSDSKTRFATRNSGYTRITYLGPRVSDASEMVRFGFVDEKVITDVIKPKSDQKKETNQKKGDQKLDKKIESKNVKTKKTQKK